MEESKFKLFERAGDPTQYDQLDLGWAENQGSQSPRSEFIWQNMESLFRNVEGKDILDIGTGSGWLLGKLKHWGAGKAIGLDPSVKNIKSGQNIFPDVEFINSNLENADLGQRRFDIVTSVLSFSHVKEVNQGIEKVASLLKDDGEFILVVSDFDYSKLPRHGYSLEVEDINDDEYFMSVKRDLGTTSDIIRKNKVYEMAALKCGLVLKDIIQMKPSDEYISRVPTMGEFKQQAIFDLLRFTK